MYRVTTPTYTFSLPFNASEISKLFLTFEQSGVKVLNLKETDVVLANKTVTAALSQEQTKLLEEGDVYIQMRVLMNNGKVLASKPITLRVKRVSNEEVFV